LIQGYKVKYFKPAKSISELCNICKEIKESYFCIIDTSSNNNSMIFALGIAFGNDKKFIQIHNTGKFNERPISDLRNWAIEYTNCDVLEAKLKEELEKRLGDN